MKNTAQILGLPLMGIKQGVRKGKVAGFIADAAQKRVTYLVLESEANRFIAQTLPVEKIIGVGGDYVIIRDLDLIEPLGQKYEEGENSFVLGSKVVSCEGDYLGNVEGFSFNEYTGEINTIYLREDSQFTRDQIVAMSTELIFVSFSDDIKTIFKDDSPASEQPADASSAEGEDIAARQEAVLQDGKSYLLGKVTMSDVSDAGGNLIVAAGTEIDEDVIQAVNEAEAMMELVLSVD